MSEPKLKKPWLYYTVLALAYIALVLALATFVLQIYIIVLLTDLRENMRARRASAASGVSSLDSETGRPYRRPKRTFSRKRLIIAEILATLACLFGLGVTIVFIVGLHLKNPYMVTIWICWCIACASSCMISIFKRILHCDMQFRITLEDWIHIFIQTVFGLLTGIVLRDIADYRGIDLLFLR